VASFIFSDFSGSAARGSFKTGELEAEEVLQGWYCLSCLHLAVPKLHCVSPGPNSAVLCFYVSPTSLVVVQATALPFPDDSFDTVVQTFGLCSESDPARALAEMQVCGVA